MNEFSLPPRDDTATSDAGDTPSVLARVADYTRALDNLKDILLSGRDVDALLQTVCIEVAKSVPDADMVGITVLKAGDKHPETAASTHAQVNDIDADQYRADEGPCLEASRTRTMVRVRVSEIVARWPRFAATVADIGVNSYLSAPLTLDDKHVGALNLYSRDGNGFSDVDEVLVRLFVTAIEAAINISRRAQSAEEEVLGLTTAMRTRADIEQAKGILMAVRGIPADEAFAILSEQSQNRNVKVTDLAASMIASITSKQTGSA